MAYAKDYIDNIKNITGQPSAQVISEATKGTATGTLIGAAVGMAIGHQRKANLLLSAFVGGLAGGVITSFFIQKK